MGLLDGHYTEQEEHTMNLQRMNFWHVVVLTAVMCIMLASVGEAVYVTWWKTPNGDSMVDETNNALYVSAATAFAPTSFTPSDGCTLLSQKINISSATTTTVVSSVASNYIKVYGLFFRVGSSGANNVTVRDSTPTTLIDLLDFTAKESLFLQMQPTPWFASAASTGFQIVTSTATPVVGRVYYTQCTVAP